MLLLNKFEFIPAYKAKQKLEMLIYLERLV